MVTAAVVAIAAGCSTRPAQISSAAPVPRDSVLLTVEEANTTLGSTDMQLTGPINRETFTNNLPTKVSPPDCVSTATVALDPVYSGSGYTAIIEERLADNGPDFQPTHLLEQAVASFPSADLALAFVNKLAGKWKACAGQDITVQTAPTTAPGIYSEQRYTTGGLIGEVPKIALSKTGGTRDCQRALDAVSNLVIDVEACGSPLGDRGRQIVDKMAAKATR
jgi:PknH-like extracellular domain